MVIYEGGLIIVHPVSAQTSSTPTIPGNMTIPMMDSASLHLKTADELAAMNQTQVMEFIVGGSLSSMRVASNYIIDNQAMVHRLK